MDVISYIKGLLEKAATKDNDNKNESSKDYNDVLDKIDELYSSAMDEKPSLGETVSYERMTYDAPTDEEISESAKSSLASYAESSKNSIDNEIATLISKYGSDKDANASAYANTLKSLNEAYEKAKEESNNDALRRGLARSSIAANTAAALSKSKAEASGNAAAAYEKANAEIDAQIAGLEVKRQKAMDEFNIAYTAKLTQEINRLKAEREEKKSEVIKYNNSLAEKENKYAIDKAKTESDLYTESLAQQKEANKLKENPDAVTQDKIYQQVYTLLRDKLLTMSAAEAKEEVSKNTIYRQYLSNAYYYKLYDEFAR